MNMLLWLWIIALLAAGGMTALAVVRPRLKAAWWLALATALLMTLLWAAAYPSTPRVLVWPGVWSPVLSPPGSHLSPWTWAAGLALLTASWAGLARSAYPLPTASVTDPRPWSAWLLLTVGSLTALTATQGWATALAWAAVDAAVLGVELQGHATNRARRAAWQRTAVRALFWAVPLAAPRLEPSQAGLVWAGAMLLRAWASPRQGDPARSAFAPAGRWLFWMPWAVTLVPWLHAPAGDLSSPARLAIAGVGLVAAVRALRTLDPAVRRRGWTTTATALVMLAAQHDPQGAQAWWLLLFVAGLSLEGLMRIPDPWLSGGLAVLLVGPALLWPFTPGAAVLASWPWPPSAETGALALLYALLLALAWRHWPRGPETLATAPRGSQILVATGLFALPAALWGAGLRLGWFTPPAQSPGWLPWGVGPALFGLAFALERIPWLRAARQDRAPRAAALRRPEDLLRWGLAAWGQSVENALLFVVGLLEGEGGIFWALAALALGLLAWKGG